MAPIRSKLMEISYSDPKFQIRLTGYADTVIIDSGTQQTISAIRFGGYPEVVRALSDAIYGGASVELKQNDTTLYLDCRPKGYRRLLSHDGIYAVATLMANDDSQTEENAADDSDEDVPENPRKCYIFCPPGDRASLFAEVDRKTAAPLIPEFQDYVLDSLIARGDLRQMKVLSFTERMEAWSLTLLPEDQNVTDILEQGLKDGRITIPGAAMDAADGFAEVNSVTSYLNTFGVTVADRIRSQFVPKFDPASEPLSEEILEVNDYIHEKAGYSLYDAQLAVAEAVKRQLCQHKMALIVAECGSGKTKLSAAAAGALNALNGRGTGKSFNLVMCPSHVTGKWVREIAETLPDTYGMVVKSITDVDRLFDLYQRGDKNVYAVFSKERARDGYMRYPAVLWSRRKRGFVCPDCLELIEMETSGDGTRYMVPSDQFFFQKEHLANHLCPHCGTPLWAPVNDRRQMPWIKIGGYVDTDSLIAGTQNTFTVLSDSEELRRTLQAATTACMDNRTILHFDGDRLTLHCTGEVGSSNAALTVIPLTGQPTGDYCFAVDRLERCLRALRGTVTLGIAQTGMLTLSTEDAFYMQTQLRMTASKAKPARKKAARAA